MSKLIQCFYHIEKNLHKLLHESPVFLKIKTSRRASGWSSVIQLQFTNYPALRVCRWQRSPIMNVEFQKKHCQHVAVGEQTVRG